MSLPYVGGRELTYEEAQAYYRGYMPTWSFGEGYTGSYFDQSILDHFAGVDSTSKQILARHLVAAAPTTPLPPPPSLSTPGVPHAGFEFVNYSPDPRAGALEVTSPPITHTAADMGLSMMSPAPTSFALTPTQQRPMLSLGSAGSGFSSSIGSLSPSIYSMLGYPSATTSFLPSGGQPPVSIPGSVGGVAADICTQYGVPASICALGGAAVDRWLGGSGATSGSGVGGTQTGGSTLAVTCQPGYVLGPDGTCILDITPGGGGLTTGAPTIYPSNGQAAVIGAMGMPAVVPRLVGSVLNARNEQRPILRCPPRMVLGADNLCYMKPLAARWRKWKPTPKPPVSAEDARAIRQAAAAKKRVKKLAGSVGLVTHARGAHRGK